MTGILLSLLGGKVSAVPDPYFEYTTLLLPGNGTNGAQNNTFLDASTNNFTITRNGNTTQGTFSPFSQTGWSNYFDGNGDELNAGSNAAFAFGTQAYTVEFFVYKLAAAVSGDCYVFNDTSGGFGVFDPNNLQITTRAGSSIITSGTTVPLNQWSHVVAVRSGTSANQTSIFLNGTRVANGTDSTNWTVTGPLKIAGISLSGYYVTGYLSNVRVVKGTAVYDPTLTTLTVPTAPLTAISGTSLLTCQSNRFVDNSTNNFAITVNGNTSVQAFSPFNPTASWSAATYGGSGYFDGNGDYLSVASSGAQPQGTEDWCIEMWIYLTTISTTTDTPWIEVSTNNGVQIYTTTSGTVLAFGIYGIGNVTTYTLPSGITNAWNHFVFTRSSNAWRLMHNGVLRANGTSSASLSTGTMSIFSRGASNYSTGYCGLTRVVRASIPTEYQTSSTTNGTSIYTVPTAPATTTSQGATSGDVELLLTFTNAGIYDATSKNDLETVGNAQISTTQSKWGGSSMAFDGTGDYLVGPANNFYNFGTGDFTIECWLRLNATSSAMMIASTNYNSVTGAGGWAFIYRGDISSLSLSVNSNVTYTKSWSPSTSNWYHVAASRSGSSLRLFVDGTQIGTTSTSTDNVSGSSTIVVAGNLGGGTNLVLNGYLQDLRITNYARYTSNFTAPTSPFPLL